MAFGKVAIRVKKGEVIFAVFIEKYCMLFDFTKCREKRYNRK
jgi:hypothetical protein